MFGGPLKIIFSFLRLVIDLNFQAFLARMHTSLEVHTCELKRYPLK
jgi:hypothetical protein